MSTTKQTPFLKASSIALPPVLLQQSAATLQSRWSLNILPEIHRVCLVVDNKIFLWLYSSEHDSPHFSSSSMKASDICMYDGLEQIVSSVATLKPAPNVFQKEVQYILAVATASYVTLLAIIFDRPGDFSSPVRLLPTHLAVSLDDHPVTSMATTSSGRLFLALADGSIDEFCYTTSSFNILSWLPFSSSDSTKNTARRHRLVKPMLRIPSSISLFIDNTRKRLWIVAPLKKTEGFMSLFSKVKTKGTTSVFCYSFTSSPASALRFLGKILDPLLPFLHPFLLMKELQVIS
ncbi:hypothetical protein GEMRC1_007268 [Eukaryota sp. GEM-RC1]